MRYLLHCFLFFFFFLPHEADAIPNLLKRNSHNAEDAFVRTLVKLQNGIGVKVVDGVETYVDVPNSPFTSAKIALDKGFELAREIIFALGLRHPSFFDSTLIHEVQQQEDGTVALGPKDIATISKKRLKAIIDHFEAHQDFILSYLPETHNFNKALSAVPARFRENRKIDFTQTMPVQKYKKIKEKKVKKKEREDGAVYYTPEPETTPMTLLEHYCFLIDDHEFKGQPDGGLSEEQQKFKERFEYLIKHYLLFLNEFYFGGCYKIGMFLEQGYPVREKENDKLKVKPVDYFKDKRHKEILEIIFNWYARGKNSVHPQILGSLARMYFDQKDEQNASIYVKKAFEATYDNLEGRRWLMGILYLTHTESIPDIEHVDDMPDSTKAAIEAVEKGLIGISKQQTQTHSVLKTGLGIGALWGLYQTFSALGLTLAEINNRILDFTNVETETQDIIELATNQGAPVVFGLAGAAVIGVCCYCTKGYLQASYMAAKSGVLKIKESYGQRRKKKEEEKETLLEEDEERREATRGLSSAMQEVEEETENEEESSEFSDDNYSDWQPSEEAEEDGALETVDKSPPKKGFFQRIRGLFSGKTEADEVPDIEMGISSEGPPEEDDAESDREDLERRLKKGAPEESSEDDEDRKALEEALQKKAPDEEIDYAQKQALAEQEKQRDALAKAVTQFNREEKKHPKKDKKKKRYADSGSVIVVSPKAFQPASSLNPPSSPPALFEISASTSSTGSSPAPEADASLPSSSSEPAFNARSMWKKAGAQAMPSKTTPEDFAARSLLSAIEKERRASLLPLTDQVVISSPRADLAAPLDTVRRDSQQEALLGHFAKVMFNIQKKAQEKEQQKRHRQVMEEAATRAREQGLRNRNLANFATTAPEKESKPEVAPGVRLKEVTNGAVISPEGTSETVPVNSLAIKAAAVAASPNTPVNLTDSELVSVMKALSAQQTYECHAISKKARGKATARSSRVQ